MNIGTKRKDNAMMELAKDQQKKHAVEGDASCSDRPRAAGVRLLCYCGKDFFRSKKYLDQTLRNDPLYVWTCKLCDDCLSKKVNESLKNLHHIVDVLAM